MSLAKFSGGTAKILMILGGLLLTFMIYQLWGTDLQHSRAQNSLKGDFSELLEDRDNPSIEASIGTGIGAGAVDSTDSLTTGGNAVINSVSQKGDFVPGSKFQLSETVIESLPLLYRDSGEAIAKISIRRLGVSEVIVEGTDVEDLKKGPGHYATTPLPGQPGNASIAGHRTTYGAPFANIHKLEDGDEILVETIQGTFTYRVISIADNTVHRIVTPGQVSVLDYKEGNHLTLTSCHPRFSAAQRIIVRAELIGDPVAPLPRPEQISNTSQVFLAGTTPELSISTSSFGTGLNGDSSVLWSTILWGLAVAALLALTVVWSIKWRKWRAYSLSILPVLFAVYTFFYYLDRVLPSY